jgi:multisubunit Na+/H+ antiporter MnhC subunit
VDPFALVMTVLVVGLVVAVVLLGLFYPGSGAEQLDWRPTRSAELEAANDVDDVDQMRAAIEEHRRARARREADA